MLQCVKVAVEPGVEVLAILDHGFAVSVRKSRPCGCLPKQVRYSKNEQHAAQTR